MGRKKIENRVSFNVRGDFEVTKEWLENQLKSGLTDSDVSRNLNVSREYVRQIKEHFKIKVSKDADWLSKRYKVEGLSKEFLIGKIKEHGAVDRVAKDLGVTKGVVLGFFGFFGLKVSDIKEYRKVLVGKCATCGKEIERKEYRTRVNQNLFCSRKCNGKFKNLNGRKKMGEVSKFVCAICGKEFERNSILVRVGQVNFYCSSECEKKKWKFNK